MPHNIERSASRAGEFIGYGYGRVWRISRVAGGRQYRAEVKSGAWYMPQEAPTLSALSKLIGEEPQPSKGT